MTTKTTTTTTKTSTKTSRIKTKDDNDIKDDNVVKISHPLRMRRVTSSWSAGDFDALSKA